MIYVCVPVHNEASTVGLVLWKVRQVFTAFEREYQIVACDDASTDGTADVLTSYARVLPLTVIKHQTRQGYARQWAPRLLRVGGGVKDSISGFTALRLIVLRQATRGGDAPLLTAEGWAANAELLARLGPHARRIEVVPSAARYDLKQRPSRSSPWQQLLAAWRSRGLINAARKGGAGAATVALLVALLGAPRGAAAQDTICTGVPAGAATAPMVP